MEDIELKVTFKGKKTTLVLREEEEGLNGFIGKDHVLTLEIDDEDELEEVFCHDDLEYDGDRLGTLVEAALEAEEDEDDEDEEDEEDEEESDEEDGEESEEDEEEGDEEEEEESEEEVEEDADADYGTAVEPAGHSGVPTLHAVMVAYGTNIGVDGDIRLARQLFEKLQEHGIANVQETLLTGAEATAANALSSIKGIEADEDDIVWFLYSGHGGMEEGDRLLITHGKYLRRGDVSDAVRDTGARLRIVLSDCCANEMGRLPPAAKLDASSRNPDQAARLKKLFGDYRGTFDVSSSSDFQYSFGGVFTPALIEKVLLKRTPQTWNAVFEETQTIAMASSEGAMSEDGRRALKKEGREIIDVQKPVAFALPVLNELAVSSVFPGAVDGLGEIGALRSSTSKQRSP